VSWVDPILDELARSPGVAYLPGGTTAAEPTALAALAFLAHGRHGSAQAAANELAAMQQASGEVGVRSGENSPGWPTSLAVVAWRSVGNALRGVPLTADSDRALGWLLSNRGQGVERSDNFGHNTELVGWAYAEGTHSWVEPTSFAVLALKAADRGQTPAAREGVSVLIDRQLPGGGLNYGNTFVLGQLIRPHIQPTGIGLLALRGETDPSGRLEKSIAWLRRSIGPETTPLSLAWAILGLNAQQADVAQADEWLAAAAKRVNSRDRSPHKLALLALAAKGWPQ
jgi:hypothetical protein